MSACPELSRICCRRQTPPCDITYNEADEAIIRGQWLNKMCVCVPRAILREHDAVFLHARRAEPLAHGFVGGMGSVTLDPVPANTHSPFHTLIVEAVHLIFPMRFPRCSTSAFFSLSAVATIGAPGSCSLKQTRPSDRPGFCIFFG